MRQRFLDVPGAVDYLEQTLGMEWLKENLKLLKGYAGGGGSFGRGIDPHDCGVSPAAYYWYRAREELALIDIGGGAGSGTHALKAAVLGDDLYTLRECRGLNVRVEGLKDPVVARDIIMELAIASGYTRNGLQPDFNAKPGVFNVSGRKILVYTADSGFRGNFENAGGTNEQGMVLPEGVTVVYLYDESELDLDGPNHDQAGAGGVNGATDGVPVVLFSFTSRYENRGPVLMRTGRLTSGQWHELEHLYIPAEKIMPG